MASPMPLAPMGSQNARSQAAPEVEESGMQVRPMSLKVHYTFDRDSKVNCLARFPHTMHVQTIAVDETTSIGVVDLRACVQAVTECSPELAGHDYDYTIYALDYSEPDTPLVGQGMLSWALDSMRGDNPYHQPKLVTGRVTKNLLGVFAGGNRETLEVKLKLAESNKLQRREGPMDQQSHQQTQQQGQQQNTQYQQQQNSYPQHNQQQPQQQLQQQPMQQQQQRPQSTGPMETAMTPTGTAEWNSFMQSNPQIGHQQPVGRLASPALSQGPAMSNRRDSFGPGSQHSMPLQEIQRVAPIPVDPNSHKDPTPSSRPSSRTSNRAPRKRIPTGRPRGRPRKKPAEGNTSGYEDGTEGEEGPLKKRAKTTKADKSTVNPFTTDSESLRVAASTSGSLRSFRPIGINSEAVAGSHLQEMPRAPTPVPDGSGRGPARGPGMTKMRRESTLGQQSMINSQLSFGDGKNPLSPEDGRSPDSSAPTPCYSHDSPADIGSSPPVQRTTPFIQSSPPPSSPVLPPMPSAGLPQDGSFEMSMDDLFGEELYQAPPMPSRVQSRNSRKILQSTTVNGIPHQVFQVQDGPDGQDLVHIRNYNNPHPNLNTAVAHSDGSSLPPLNQTTSSKAAARPKKRSTKRPSPPAQVPTPPATTDALEKAPSPPMPTEPIEVLPKPTAPEPAALGETVTGQDMLELAFMEQYAPVLDEQMTMGPAFSELMAAESTAPQSVEQLTESTTGSTANSSSRSISGSEPPPQQEALIQLPASKPRLSKPNQPRHLSRSQSAGPLALPTIPASEPAGPSSLSQSMSAGPGLSEMSAPSKLKRSSSSGPLAIPASDPVGPSTSMHRSALALPEQSCPQSDVLVAPSSPPAGRSNKNFVKKHAIKQRLEEAILLGEMPPFCSNCGAIETPTWRKMWVQDKDGVPEYCEYSEKPGRVTAIDILKRDGQDKPTAFRLIKKALGPDDDKKEWQEVLLCNPCGIWLTKWRCHRPQDRWDKDASRLGQERRKRGTGRSMSRSKKASAKGGPHTDLTSEAYLPTDALGPIDASSPGITGPPPPMGAMRYDSQQSEGPYMAEPSVEMEGVEDSQTNPASTHSRGSASVAVNPELDQQLGNTKRLLFPSPRKEGIPKALCELDINIVQTPDDCRLKDMVSEKKNLLVASLSRTGTDQDDLEALFRSPAVTRPTTPPPNARSTPTESFKTPTRPTPSHRPVTRSVSRSLRSVRALGSPSQEALLLQLQQTPSRSSGRKRSPHMSNNHVDFGMFETPISRTINQMLSESHGFQLGDHDLDLGNLPSLDGDHNGLIDFGNLLSTDGVMPSSPPKDGDLSFDYSGSANVWAQWQMDNGSHMDTEE